MRALLLILLATFLPFQIGFARDLSLGEALSLARAHSFAVKQAEANAEAASSLHEAGQRDRLPTLDIKGTANYVSYVPTFDIELPLGQSLSREIGTHEHYQTDVRLTMPLYTGGKLSGGIDRAEAILQINRALTEATIEQVYLQTRVEYYQLYRYDRMLSAAKASLERAKITSGDVQSMYDAGAADSTDLLEARLNLTDAQFAHTQAVNARRSEEIRLLTLLGLDYDESVVLTDTAPAPTGVPSNEEVSSMKAELQTAEASISLSRADLKMQKSGFLPTLAAYGGWSYGKPNLDMFNNTWNDYFTVGAQLSWSFNIGNKTGHQVRAAEYQLDAARRHFDNVNETLSREAELRWQQMQLAFDAYTTARTRYETTSDNYRLARTRFQDGALASNRLLEIEQMLTAAEFSMAASVADYHIARSAWLYAIGSEQLKEGN
ncbi:TolC family protein [bacterium]|nr:TolC family protein [bacterium]